MYVDFHACYLLSERKSTIDDVSSVYLSLKRAIQYVSECIFSRAGLEPPTLNSKRCEINRNSTVYSEKKSLFNAQTQPQVKHLPHNHLSYLTFCFVSFIGMKVALRKTMDSGLRTGGMTDNKRDFMDRWSQHLL